MEIALRPDIPTYSGGLGVLAGDTIRSAADLRLPMVGVSLLYRRGYFSQQIDREGWQQESPAQWRVEDALTEAPIRISVALAGREVRIRAWLYDVKGLTGFVVPVFLLDSDLPENAEADRGLTHALYGGDTRYRLCQEAILGIGGVRMLRALGFRDVQRFHMNEGHASLLALELLDERARKARRSVFTADDIDAVRRQCIFTTHTPVPAGHDQFPTALVRDVLGDRPELLNTPSVLGSNGVLDMTHLAMNVSHYVNGVAKRHGEVSRQMFNHAGIDAITNGVHAVTWTSPPFQELFDRHIPTWRDDGFSLRHALSIPLPEIWNAHEDAKRRLIGYVASRAGVTLDPAVLTLGFARRATPYKRADLFFHDLDRLRDVVSRTGKLQVVYAGKAHPHDQDGKEMIHRIVQAGKTLKNELAVAYLENYDMTLGGLVTAGVDVWLNTPQPPLEASGTSGMKAAMNGVPSLSILDGWWVEGHIENVTGWAFGDGATAQLDSPRDPAVDARALYDKLETTVMPCFYGDPTRFMDIMRHAIALNGSFFNTQRMVQQYVVDAYFPSASS
jgi:starch phosphorylase